MEIKTKSNLGDILYYIGRNNKLEEVTITGIQVECSKDSLNIRYGVGSFCIDEEEIGTRFFKDKSELLNYIISQL